MQDDPVCVAARKDGRKVVTGLWVDDSVDLGAMVDADHVGEEYELAKMVKINIINHQWLEDCLKAWDILPVDNYTARSCWELEIMEAEAKDSEDEAQSSDRGLSDSRGRTPADLYGHIPINGPSVFYGNADVPAGTHVGALQQIREVKDASEWSVDVMADTLSTPNTNVGTISADPEAHAHAPQTDKVEVVAADSEHDKLASHKTFEAGPMEIPITAVPGEFGVFSQEVSTSQQIREVEDASERSLDVIADILNTPKTNGVAISANPDGNLPIHGPTVFTGNADAVVPAGRRLETSQQIREVEDVSKRSLDVRADRLSTPNTNVVTISADPDAHAHASQADKVEAVAADSEHDSMGSRATFQAGPKEIPITAVPGEFGVFPQKVSTSSVRNLGAKRSQIPEDETAAVSVHSNCDLAAYKSKHGKVLSNGSVEADLGKNCSLNAAESTTFVPEEILSRSRSAVAKSPLKSNSQMNDAIVVYKMKPANMNMEENPTTSACPTAGKTERVSFELSFLEAVSAEGSTSKVSSSATADNSETCIPKRVLKPKRRRVSSFQEGRSDSEACRTVSVLSEASTLPAESSTNAGMVTVYKGLHNADEACEDRPEDLQSSKPRSRKRQKTDHNNKENIPANTSLAPKSKHGEKRVSSECARIAVENYKYVIDDRSMTGGNDDGSLAMWEPEPTWFISSGHRLLRKECRSIFLRLKGRICCPSHHWSFQATHFITPELRRTEKFFAAAAAGRWILKPEYLFACNEAGKLVDAESFEWHGDGLNDNQTISLDASRKWQHLKQRAGHGAFYGMRIIIYGECISPSLDTLRRAVRAGDGMILATAPPYTRFLKLGAVSFAVVSAGTPSSNTWVQEFKSHGIPCVNPSYLVDYMCKPSHLEQHKHVPFDMQDLADESLRKVLSSQEGGDAEQSCSSGRMVVVAMPKNMHGSLHCIENASSNKKTVQILIDNGRPTSTLNVELDEPSRNMVENYKMKSNWNYADFYFSYKNKIILPGRTLRSYGISKGCTIDLYTRVRGGRLSFMDYVEEYKASFTEIAKLPDGNLSLKVPIGGCIFLSSFLSCVMATWSQNRRAAISIQSSCMESDVHPIIEFLDYAFLSNDKRLQDRRPPYFDHLIRCLREMKSAVPSPGDKLTIASHASYMLPFDRLLLTISLRRKYKGSSKEEKTKWDGAIRKASLNVALTDRLLELPVFNDIKAAADRRGESYPAELTRSVSFRVSRDYCMHALENRWADDPDAKPSEKDKQIEKFKDDDGIELMLPVHVKKFLANLIEQLILANIDINRELSSAVLHCTKCPIEPTHPVVAEPIGDDYMPTWMLARTKAEQSRLMNMNIGANRARPRNWTTGECSNSASMVNQQPNPWNAGKTLVALSPGAKILPLSSMPSGSSTDGVKAEVSNPVTSVRAQTTQPQVAEGKSKACFDNWKRRQARKARKEAGEKP
uniref:BRCT domain-containing protein n=2 Tax=Triticinae TaxID=1648030 RepID=M8AWQ2_AEGTA